MTSVTIIGTGTQGRALASLAEKAGATVQTIGRETDGQIAGEIVVLAVPYESLDSIVASYRPQLDGRIVLDISEPRDRETHRLLQPEVGSAAELLARQLPNSRVVKAFSTTPAEVLVSTEVSDRITTVLVVGDDKQAKQKVMRMAGIAGVEVLDDGPLERARELEHQGFLERTLEVAVDVDQAMGGGLIP